ncbi:MAG: hypothetical protein ABSE51_03215 [Terracidiphilus sp.]|jgi:hypothetical protein
MTDGEVLDNRNRDISQPQVIRGLIGVVFILPWVVVEMAEKNIHHPASGYLVGLVCGLVSARLLSDRPLRLWVSALVGAALVVLRIVFDHVS